MANEKAYLKNLLLDWENELKYCESILKDDKVDEDMKEFARNRIKEAKTQIEKIAQDNKVE